MYANSLTFQVGLGIYACFFTHLVMCGGHEKVSPKVS